MIKHYKQNGQVKLWWIAQADLPIFWSGKDAVKSAEDIRKQDAIKAAYRFWAMHYMMRIPTEAYNATKR